ncbi:MAG: HAD-IIIA family hydrolase [Gemmatimonadota bacterium]
MGESGPPTQAVILAGGRGTRLGALSATRPKPMIEFHGKPFLEYLLEMLRDQGIERVLLLLGYLPDVIQDHFGDGRRFGIEIEYSVTGPDDLTGHRLKVARPLLDPYFLLMYCDNYWPLQLERQWKRFREADVDALVTVYSNADGYSKDNVSVGEDGLIRVFDRTRSEPGLRGVEIGYAIFAEEDLDLLPEEDVLFEAAVYPALAERGRLGAFVTDHRYYSVGSPDRLSLTEAFLARPPAIILDRDGVINRRPPRAEYVRSWDEFEWLPGAADALRLLSQAGYTVIVVSNQAGIARGAMTEADLNAINDRLMQETLELGGRIDAIYYCPHGWDEGCDCRKPKPGMLFRAQRDFDLDLSRTLFVGDDERDAEAADAAGSPSILVSDERSLLDVAHRLVSSLS